MDSTDPALKRLERQKAIWVEEVKIEKRNRKPQQKIESSKEMVEHMQNQIDKRLGKRKV